MASCARRDIRNDKIVHLVKTIFIFIVYISYNSLPEQILKINECKNTKLQKKITFQSVKENIIPLKSIKLPVKKQPEVFYIFL